jgi:hypothetical protein
MNIFEKKKKIVLACPSMNDLCCVNFATSLHATNWPGERPPILISKAKWVAKALHEMVLRSRELKADYMIWISNDVAWESDTVKKLIAHDKPVIGGWAKGRYSPFQCHVADTWSPDKNKYHIIQNPTEHHGLEKVAANGGEMLCFRMDVFDKIPEPWFFGREMVLVDKDGKATELQTEDFFFFSECRKYGVDIWVDWDAPLYHMAAGLMSYKGDLIAR